MARVHLFSSSTQPYNYNRQGSPIAEEPSLSEDIIDNTTIVEGNDLDLTTSALTAALLQKTHEEPDKSIAAAFSAVKPTEPLDNSKPKDVMDQAAAATALQLLGLSSQAEETDKEKETDAIDNTMMYAGLAPPNPDDIDLNSEEMAQDYKRGTWTREEDELLLAGIRRYGYGRWKEIASSIPGRKGKQLKQRWDNTLSSKYVDQEWLKNKIKHDEALNRQNMEASSSSSPSTSTKTDDKALKFLEATDWNSIALRITEKARQGDQQAIEALLSQALLGSVTTPSTAPVSVTASPHLENMHLHQGSTPTTPTTSNTPNPDDSHNNNNTNDALSLSFSRSPIDPNNPPSLNFSDSATLALYAQQLSQSTPNSSTSALSNSYFLPFNNNTDNDNLSNAVVSQQQQQQQGGKDANYASSSVGMKRRRTDPALADTQSAAMTIYASATPITTTVNNQVQTVYPCLFPNCGKTFARLYNLKSHSRTHTDDRPFVCHACTAAFSRNHDLKRHSKIHGGDKPYRCEGCKKSFSRLDALKRHKSNQRNKQSCTED